MRRYAAIAILCGTISTSVQSRSFEVVSIKIADPTARSGIGKECHGRDDVSPSIQLIGLGRCHFPHSTLKALLAFAYGIPPQRVVGGPSWTVSTEYAIEAKAEEGSEPTRAQLLEMLQGTLRDRFKVRFHREMREVSGFTLTVGKGGAKLIPTDSAGQHRPAMTTYGMLSGQMTLSTMASLLVGHLHVPVIDQTGLPGEYDVSLKWKPMEGEPGFQAMKGSDLPSLFSALREGLGLQLNAQKVSLEFLAIDAADAPSPNN
jgi:uncharacterized protein (TIGR03435 family)